MAIAHLEEARPDRSSGRVGPNAVIQMANALRDIAGPCTTRRVFRAAGLRRLLDDAPSEMIDERVAAALFTALWQTVPDWAAEDIARDAGRRTADYILAHRIPRFAQTIVRNLPPAVAGPLLLSAIRKNAWTFAGSGVCSTSIGSSWVFEIMGNPLAMPGCVWHQAVFERLFGELVATPTQVFHPACCAAGDATCRFEVRLSKPHPYSQ